MRETDFSRREFFKQLGLGVAAGALSGCTRMPPEQLLSGAVSPPSPSAEGVHHYASSFEFDGYAQPVLVESHGGRPTQVHGHPAHPAGGQGSAIHMQASLLDLHHPQRMQSVTKLGVLSTWEAFAAAMAARQLVEHSGLRILTGTVTSPTLSGQLAKFLARDSGARWHAWQAVHLDRQKEAARLFFGHDLVAIPRFDKARVIVSFGADFLGPGPAQLVFARDFADRREPGPGRNRLYVIETGSTQTGAMADHRLAVRPGLLTNAALALARELGVRGLASPSALPADLERWLTAAARDLRDHASEALVLAGAQESVATQLVCHAIGHKLGSFGRTSALIAPPEASAVRQEDSLRELVVDMKAGRVSALLVSGCNPLYDTPGGLRFKEALANVPLTIRHGLFPDETAAACTWALPATHFLEEWGDARAFDGTVSLRQPLISPLCGGRSLSEVLALLLGDSGASSRSILKDHWRASRPQSDEAFEPFFDRAVTRGFIAGTTAAAVDAKPVASDLAALTSAPTVSSGLELRVTPDPTIWDGRHFDNGWLQELPKPMLQLTWRNAALLSPPTATRLGLASGDLVSLRVPGAVRPIDAPVLVVPGHADECVTVPLGYGRTHATSTACGRGTDAYQLLGDGIPTYLGGVSVERVGRERVALALVHEHHSMEGRALARTATLTEWQKNPAALIPPEARTPPPTLLPSPEASAEEWAMSIDLNRCIGCTACVVACQSENNIPFVGEAEVLRGREMHWIRVDRYTEPGSVFQPVPCMHCETAPCELVCPTVATNHSSDGLNQMVYNRCVGTRYCSNNCPYKVRRFNFLGYSEFEGGTPSLMRNPEVTVRSRGVMEKCTYCVQRIEKARITARREHRAIADGEIRTACQQACPTRAIVFGNKADPASAVARLRADPRRYDLLAELGTRPRTTYLARIDNPNPAVSP